MYELSLAKYELTRLMEALEVAIEAKATEGEGKTRARKGSPRAEAQEKADQYRSVLSEISYQIYKQPSF